MDRLPTLEEIEAAAAIVYRHLPPTPQYAWPLLAEALGCRVWVKHENHTPTGAFKVRGGVVYLERLRQRLPAVRGVATATRGNHGQSVAFAAAAHGLEARVYVPHGNSVEKNAAMRAFGARLVEAGGDFQEARETAIAEAERDGLHMLPSFHPDLVAGVASYPAELFRAVPDLDAVYVPVGLGSGLCATLAARDALSPATEVIGVVSTEAQAYRLSFEAGEPVSTNSAATVLADGMACRVPEPDAVALINAGAARILAVGDGEVAEAMRSLYRATHNLAEGAGAAALAALAQERERQRGRRVAVMLTGGNVDAELFVRVLSGTL
ncbi:threonine dehydratase [Tistlia consotensis]|uniref:Threonine dehydratase n=1 Tax=Tistlia consotensis USBA 355 TaxID=560819 RepID=A0A1Y6BNQ8_9PROT|nr:threonine dehydratase [Tistlia consotensis]SMF21545.1 threonine dehydratase [Tistlia consotensis USBA 355]SNR46819.1 threonine dehydratase [Tistlia consotensis]